MAWSEKTLAENTAIWATALRLGEFSYASLAAECQIPIPRTMVLVKGWVRMRLVEFSHITRIRRKVFKLTPAAHQVDLPANLVVLEPVTSAEENMWRSARMLQSFGSHDLAIHSTTPAVTVTDEAAAKFCQVLLKGGYLKVLRKASFKRAGKSMVRTHAIYRLVRNTGPMPPVERRVMAVWDPNLGEYTHVAGVAA